MLTGDPLSTLVVGITISLGDFTSGDTFVVIKATDADRVALAVVTKGASQGEYVVGSEEEHLSGEPLRIVAGDTAFVEGSFGQKTVGIAITRGGGCAIDGVEAALEMPVGGEGMAFGLITIVVTNNKLGELLCVVWVEEGVFHTVGMLTADGLEDLGSIVATEVRSYAAVWDTE